MRRSASTVRAAADHVRETTEVRPTARDKRWASIEHRVSSRVSTVRTAEMAPSAASAAGSSAARRSMAPPPETRDALEPSVSASGPPRRWAAVGVARRALPSPESGREVGGGRWARPSRAGVAGERRDGERGDGDEEPSPPKGELRGTTPAAGEPAPLPKPGDEARSVGEAQPGVPSRGDERRKPAGLPIVCAGEPSEPGEAPPGERWPYPAVDREGGPAVAAAGCVSESCEARALSSCCKRGSSAGSSPMLCSAASRPTSRRERCSTRWSEAILASRSACRRAMSCSVCAWLSAGACSSEGSAAVIMEDEMKLSGRESDAPPAATAAIAPEGAAVPARPIEAPVTARRMGCGVECRACRGRGRARGMANGRRVWAPERRLYVSRRTVANRGRPKTFQVQGKTLS